MKAALATLLLILAAPAFAADSAPAIAHANDWRAAVRQFAEANLKHPAWGASHSLRDYEFAKELAAADKISPAGKARAPQRVRELEDFLRALRAQSADYRAL